MKALSFDARLKFLTFGFAVCVVLLSALSFSLYGCDSPLFCAAYILILFHSLSVVIFIGIMFVVEFIIVFVVILFVVLVRFSIVLVMSLLFVISDACLVCELCGVYVCCLC